MCQYVLFAKNLHPKTAFHLKAALWEKAPSSSLLAKDPPASMVQKAGSAHSTPVIHYSALEVIPRRSSSFTSAPSSDPIPVPGSIRQISFQIRTSNPKNLKKLKHKEKLTHKSEPVTLVPITPRRTSSLLRPLGYESDSNPDVSFIQEFLEQGAILINDDTSLIRAGKLVLTVSSMASSRTENYTGTEYPGL